MKTILIIDDDVEIRHLLREYLETQDGYKTVLAGDGEEAARILDYVKPDLILLDVMLPKVSGVALIRLLKNITATRNIPIIFISGQFTHESFRRDGLEMGAADYFTKPLNLKNLRNRISEFLLR